MLTSLQKPSCILMHLLYRLRAKVNIVFVDTQFHFMETLDLRNEYCDRYDLKITTVYPDFTPEEQHSAFGGELYLSQSGQKTCCQIRKEKPFLAIAKLLGTQALISSLMRSERSLRAVIPPIGVDTRIGAKAFYPIFDWREEEVEAYIEKFKLPIHPLYQQGYASIGCAPCTTPILPGEDKRAGRWRHLKEQQGGCCLINQADYQI